MNRPTTNQANELKNHPAADLFPMMTSAEISILAEDIKTNGQQVPIDLCNGLILDGRNRWKACLEAGVEPQTITINPSDPVDYVVSLNVLRRHLNEGQRAMVAADVATMKRGENQHTAGAASISQGEAAAMLHVSVDSVQRAKKVIKKGIPQVVDAVKNGEWTVKAAARVVELPDDEQESLWEIPLRLFLFAIDQPSKGKLRLFICCQSGTSVKRAKRTFSVFLT